MNFLIVSCLSNSFCLILLLKLAHSSLKLPFKVILLSLLKNWTVALFWKSSNRVSVCSMSKIYSWSKKWPIWSLNYKKLKKSWSKRQRWVKNCQIGLRSRFSRECIFLRNWTSLMLSFCKREWSVSLVSMTAKTTKFTTCRHRLHSKQDKLIVWNAN